MLEELTAESGFSYLAKDVDLATAAKVEKLEIEGIGQLPASRRSYPQGEMAGQVIGVVGSEGKGLTGIEAGEESALAGEEGERRVVTDALGDPIKLETVKEARDGEDVQLTLDPVIQEKAEQVLAKVGETYSPLGATAIVMNPETSEILAMANWPPVDPGDLENAKPEDLPTRRPASTTNRARPSRRSRSRPRSKKAWSRRRPNSPSRRRSKSANGSSKTPRNTAPKT